MHRLRLVALVFLLAARAAAALDTVCTVERFDIDGTMPFANVGAVGLAFPVSIDEASGRFTLSRDPWVQAYGSGGLGFLVGFGTIHGFIALDPGIVEGTIDAAGQVTLPHFTGRVGTDYLDPPSYDEIDATLSTGVQLRTLGSEPHAFAGVPLDFATGELTLVGVDTVNLVITTLTGPRVRCRLGAVPSAAALPATGALRKVTGKGRTSRGGGSRLVLKAVVAPGGLPLALDGGDEVVVRLGAADAENAALLVRVPEGALAVSGQRVGAEDRDGSVVQVLAGRSSGPAAGRLAIKKSKKAVTVTLTLAGVDLASLSGASQAVVGLGTRTFVGPVTVKAGKRGTTIR